MDQEITELFDQLIKKYGDLESAHDALKMEIENDLNLSDEYSEWCRSVGHSEKKGFTSYYHEYMEHRDSIWDSIYPNKEEYDGYM